MSRLVQLLVSSFVCRNHSRSMRLEPHYRDIQEQGSVFRRYSQSLDSPTNYLVENARLASLPKFTRSGGSKLSQRAREAMRERNVTARLATGGLVSLQKSQQIKKIRASLLSILLRHSGAAFGFPVPLPILLLPSCPLKSSCR